MPWSVYIIVCDDGSLYTGIATDVSRRFQQHLDGNGAKFFRARKPLSVVYQEPHPCRGSASRREADIKKLSRRQKLALLKYAGAVAYGGGIFQGELGP